MSRGVAVVTGASAGIGRVFAERLAARGYDLMLVARDRARLEALRAELGERYRLRIDAVPADLARDEDVDRLAATLRATPRLALLVNNAGFGTLGTLAEADPAGQADMIRVHVLAAMRLAQAALGPMLARGDGAIVNVSSVAAFVIGPGNVNYCATKAYLVTFSRALATELAGTGVQVQALCPGWTRSEFHRRMRTDMSGLPGWLWLSADEVVEASLRSLTRRGPVVVVPGGRWKVITALVRLTPGGLIGRLARYRRRRAPDRKW